MTTRNALWIKRVLIGALAAALPQVLMARSPQPGDAPDACPPMAHGAPRPAPGMMPPPLDGIELSDAQEDARFELMQAQAASSRLLERKAARASQELHRLSAGERFNSAQARVLAETYAQALAQLVLGEAEFDAKRRAVLTPAQRRQIDAPDYAPAAPRHPPAEQ